jgi:LysM repeat protein
MGGTRRGLVLGFWAQGVWAGDSVRLSDDETSATRAAQRHRPVSSPVCDSPDAPTSPTAVIFTRRGDYLRAVARRYDVPLARLLEFNPGLNDRNFQEGDALRIPLKPGGDAPSCPLELEVRRGPRGHKRVALTFDSSWLDRDRWRIWFRCSKRTIPRPRFS